ncbi:GatB/YqeY domain-containing protein [bacterium]|nr:GatB/YqeY domain-containing protein [bacterium]
MLLEEIQKQYITAFKSKDALTTSVLGLLKSAIQYKQIDLKAQQKEMNDDIILDVIKAEVKKHKESIEQYDQANRKELADKERAELEILNRFLPAQMSRESVVDELTKVLSSFPPEEAKNFGKMMKEAMVTLKGKADGELIKKELEILIQKLP